ncbi:unnamed protein product [Blepharisma stoltei]|uniref:RING-type E3 ubiquitin transferase n=1 Tax=Blepharisma stoltei TaxID=1481888 RepID=A0AAU9JZL7_9CILI|nr:unnamed protein product [Blepharisma stoltei]
MLIKHKMSETRSTFVPGITGYDKYSVLSIYILYTVTKIAAILILQDTYSSRCVLDLSVYLILYTTIEIFDAFLLLTILIRKLFHLEQPPKMFIFSIQLSMETFRIMILVVTSIDLVKEMDCLHGAIEILAGILVCSEIIKVLFLIKPAHNFVNEVMAATSYDYFDDATMLPQINLDPYIKSDVSDSFCTICLDDQKTDERRVALPCKHNFHYICMNTWVTFKNSCPVCRSTIS